MKKQISKKILDNLCREIIRIRDNNTCQMCGKKINTRNSHSSHVFPKRKYPHLRWNLLNLKLLCFHCHQYKWHSDIITSYEWFTTKFPTRWEYLSKERYQVKNKNLIEIKNILDKKLQELKGN